MSKPPSTYLRVRNVGVRASSPVDLLAVALARSAADVELTATHARQWLVEWGDLRAVAEATPADLSDKAGFDEFEALRYAAIAEIGRRAADFNRAEVTEIDGPEDVAKLLRRLNTSRQEHFIAILLDAKNGILREVEVHRGTLTASVVGAREIYREAIREGASAIIVAHNHPSGDPTPSPEDLEVTRDLSRAGKLLDIPLLDHVVVAERGFTSLSRLGVI